MNNKYSPYYTYLKPLAENKQVTTYTPLATSIVVTILFAIFVIKPTITQISSLQAEIKQQRSLLNQLQAKNAALTQGTANYNKIDPDVVKKVDRLLPQKNSFSELLSSLSTIASQNQASVSGIQFQAVDLYAEQIQPNKNPQMIPMEFTFNILAPYQKTVNILDSLRSIDRLLSVESITMNKPEEGPLITTINAKAYILR